MCFVRQCRESRANPPGPAAHHIWPCESSEGFLSWGPCTLQRLRAVKAAPLRHAGAQTAGAGPCQELCEAWILKWINFLLRLLCFGCFTTPLWDDCGQPGVVSKSELGNQCCEMHSTSEQEWNEGRQEAQPSHLGYQSHKCNVSRAGTESCGQHRLSGYIIIKQPLLFIELWFVPNTRPQVPKLSWFMHRALMPQ